MTAKPMLLSVSQIVKPNGLLPICRTTLYKLRKEKRFPEPIYLTTRNPMWRYDDIVALVDALGNDKADF